VWRVAADASKEKTLFDSGNALFYFQLFRNAHQAICSDSHVSSPFSQVALFFVIGPYTLLYTPQTLCDKKNRDMELMRQVEKPRKSKKYA
jgi:hypothetical protein